MINILITGGCGFISLNLLENLLETGRFNVRLVDNLSVGRINYLKNILNEHSHNLTIFEGPWTSPKFKEKEVQLVITDIRDAQAAKNVGQDIDFIVHFAANTGVVKSIEDPSADFEINTRGTFNYLESAVANKVKGFIFASSSAPLGNREERLNEHMTPNPFSPYGASKMAGEGYCSAYYHSFSLDTTILRFSNVYGRYSNHKNSVVAKFIKDLILTGNLTIYGDGEQTRDFIHVKDLCSIIHDIILKKCDDSYKLVHNTEYFDNENRIFHVASGKSTSIIDLAKMIIEVSGKKGSIVNKPSRKGEVISSSVDMSFAKKIMGFEPQISLVQGVEEVYKWFASLPANELCQIKS